MRPWRLTRRQRVEMEAALAKLREEVLSRVRDRRDEDVVLCSAAAAMGARGHLAVDERILRARVALALRAALRADEDARCEEAYMRVFLTGRLGYYGETSASNDGAWRAVEALREWPIEKRDEAGRVPRALWEVAR